MQIEEMSRKNILKVGTHKGTNERTDRHKSRKSQVLIEKNFFLTVILSLRHCPCVAATAEG